MKQETGLILRMVGPLIEVVCLALLFGSKGKNWTVGGIRAEWLLYGGFAVGFLLVGLGLVLARPAATSRPAPRRGGPGPFE